MLKQYELEGDASDIAPAPAERANRLFAVLTLAFTADPAVRWMFPDPQQHSRYFPVFARAFGGAAIECRTALVNGSFSGAALWLPPDAHPDEDGLVAVINDGVKAGQKDTAFALFEEMARYHPARPLWYLPLIGVEPASQGRGLGAALLRPVLERCDAERLPAYLEATSPRSRSLYERLGFESIGEIAIGDCPPITPMLRLPGES